MRGVFNDPEVMGLAECSQTIKINHQAADMHRDDTDDMHCRNAGELTSHGFGHFSFGVSEIHVQSVGLAVNQNRDGVHVADDFRSCRKRHGRHEHSLATRPVSETKSFDGQVESGGRRVHGYCVRGSNRLRKCVLEMSHSRTCGEPSGAENRKDFGFFARAEVRAKERNFQQKSVAQVGQILARLVESHTCVATSLSMSR
jgi:hypothetical protein